MSTNLEIKWRKISELIPYARNARIHSPEQVQQIAASIREFGFNNPILLDGDNGIIAGHGRIMGAEALGMDPVPTIELSHLSEEQKRAYILADNKIAEGSFWDEMLLMDELDLIEDVDMTDLGFGDGEIESVLGETITIKTKKGYQLGEDRYLVMIDCKDETVQNELFDEMNDRGFEVVVMA